MICDNLVIRPLFGGPLQSQTFIDPDQSFASDITSPAKGQSERLYKRHVHEDFHQGVEACRKGTRSLPDQAYSPRIPHLSLSGNSRPHRGLHMRPTRRIYGAYYEIFSRPPVMSSLQSFGPEFGKQMSVVLVAEAGACSLPIRSRHRACAVGDRTVGVAMMNVGPSRITKAAPISTEIAALPWRIGCEGTLEILVMNKELEDSWALPAEARSDWCAEVQAADRAAFRDAGVTGRIGPEALGSYCHNRLRACGDEQGVNVIVYGLNVLRVHTSWPAEMKVVRHWATPAEAAALVAEPGLTAVIAAMSSRSPTAHGNRPSNIGLCKASLRGLSAGVASQARMDRFGAC